MSVITKEFLKISTAELY